jgi:hypothetical protein
MGSGGKAETLPGRSSALFSTTEGKVEPLKQLHKSSLIKKVSKSLLKMDSDLKPILHLVTTATAMPRVKKSSSSSIKDQGQLYDPRYFFPALPLLFNSTTLFLSLFIFFI